MQSFSKLSWVALNHSGNHIRDIGAHPDEPHLHIALKGLPQILQTILVLPNVRQCMWHHGRFVVLSIRSLIRRGAFCGNHHEQSLQTSNGFASFCLKFEAASGRPKQQTYHWSMNKSSNRSLMFQWEFLYENSYIGKLGGRVKLVSYKQSNIGRS